MSITIFLELQAIEKLQIAYNFSFDHIVAFYYVTCRMTYVKKTKKIIHSKQINTEKQLGKSKRTKLLLSKLLESTRKYVRCHRTHFFNEIKTNVRIKNYDILSFRK